MQTSLNQETEIQIPLPQFNDFAHDWQIEILADFDAKMARFFLINWHRRARKTTLAINLLIRECIKYPNRRYGYITSTYKAAKNIIWRDPQMLKKYVPMELIEKFNESELFIEFKNGTILSIHGGDEPDALRGINFHGLVMDEAPQCKRELWEEILRPIIAQDKSRWALFIFTPHGRNWIYNYWVRAKDNPEWKCYSLDVWTSGIIPADEVQKIKAEIPQRTFAQEFEGAFNDNASSVFKNIQECVGGAPQAPVVGYSYVTGVDLAKVNDWTVLQTFCRETRQLVDFQRFNQVDWALQKERIIQVCNKYNSLAVVDATGVGDPIAEDLARQGISVLPFKISSSTKKELIERLIIAIEQRLITFPNIKDLVEELSAFTYDITDFGNIRYSAPEGLHDDCVISMALAVSGMKTFMYGKKVRTVTHNTYRKALSREPMNAGIGYDK